jgi:GT2 family glycosyltransferase
MTGSARVTVVTVTYNSERLLPDLFASLADGMRGTDWSLIVADNASADGTVALVQELSPNATIVETGRNGGYAAGINAALATARDFDAVLILNPDVRLGPGCAEALLLALHSSSAGFAVPRLTDRLGDLVFSLRREPSAVRAWGEALLGAERAGRHPRLGEIVSDPREYLHQHRIDWAEGSTLMVSAQCWRECGPWDESFFLYSEETEYGLRAARLGHRGVFAPEAYATHLEGGSSAAGLWTLLVVNKVRLFGRHAGRLRTASFWGAQVWRESTRALLGRASSRAAVKALINPRKLRTRPGPDWI